MIVLETTEAVTCIDILAGPAGGTKQSIVTIELGNKNIVDRNGEMSVEVAFEYKDADGNVLPTKHKGVFKVPSDSLKALSQSINAIIPDTDNIVDRFNEEVIAIAKQEMSASFSIEVEKIVKVD